MADDLRADEDDIARRRQLVERAWQNPHWREGLMHGADERSPAAPSRAGRVGRTHGDAWLERHWSSRALHRFGEVVAHAGAGLSAAAAVLVWLVVGIVVGFPDWWETVLYVASSSVTLVMVFAIQHTQTRQESATQRKLDELLRASPGADNQVIAVEEAPDEELEARTTLNLADRETTPLDSGSPPAGERAS